MISMLFEIVGAVILLYLLGEFLFWSTMCLFFCVSEQISFREWFVWFNPFRKVRK